MKQLQAENAELKKEKACESKERTQVEAENRRQRELVNILEQTSA